MTFVIDFVEDGGRFAVTADGAKVVGPTSYDDAIKVGALLVRCQSGDQAACDELDRLGIEPPTVKADIAPVADGMSEARIDTLAEIANHAAGKVIVGMDIDPSGDALLHIEGGGGIMLVADGTVRWIDRVEGFFRRVERIQRPIR